MVRKEGEVQDEDEGEGGRGSITNLTLLEPSELECSKLQTAYGCLLVSQATYTNPSTS